MTDELHCARISQRPVEAGSSDIADPVSDPAVFPVLSGKIVHSCGWQVQEHAFCDHQGGFAARSIVYLHALRRIVQVEGEALAAAARRLTGHKPVFVIEHVGEVNFNPAEVRREIKPPRSRIKTTTDAQNS